MTRSLDCGTTLRGINQVVLPFLAEMSAIVLVDDQRHVTNVELAWVNNVGQRFTASETGLEVFPDSIAVAITQTLNRDRVSTSGLRELAPAAPSDPPWCSEKYATLKLRSVIALPLTARNRTIGVLILGVCQPNRSFEPTQLSLAEEVTGRAGIAIDNCRLHESVKEHDRRKDDFLAMLGHELRNPLVPIRNAVEILRLSDSTNSIA
jgi:GAF domain-containing protein